MRILFEITRRARTMHLTPMDYIRAALANAKAERMTLHDLQRIAEHATTPQSFDEAVNLLAQTR